MNNEIKEILDELKDYSEHEYLPPCCELTNKECELLLDYITNLEQKNEKLKETVENLATFTVCGDRKQIKNTAQYKLEIAQDRIDKAIKYLVSHCVISDEWTEVRPLEFVPTGHISYKSCGKKHTENLLNILTGGDEK